MNALCYTVLATVMLLLSAQVASVANDLTIGKPEDRPDRLLTISGERSEELLAEYSTDGGEAWFPATVYVGTTIDEWRVCDYALWNQGAIEGHIPAGKQGCLWNYFFDVAAPAGEVILRLTGTQTGEVVVQQAVALSSADNVFMIDGRNCAELAGGELPAPWHLEAAGKKQPPVQSIACAVDDPTAPPLVLKPELQGWHRIYIGMEPYSACQFYLSKQQIRHAVPSYLGAPSTRGRDRFLQEFYLKSADLTGQDVCVAIGGARFWRDASLRHIRFVRMTPEEVAHFHQVRKLARVRGRPYVGYVETVEGAYTQPKELTLRGYLRNEMRLNEDRGATEVYVHVIRLGIKAWYHSDVVEREQTESEEQFKQARQKVVDTFGTSLPKKDGSLSLKGATQWAAWMKQGDPLAVALEEGHAVGLKVFADMGVNVTHIIDAPQLTERTVIEHPEYLSEHKMFIDYKQAGVRDYCVSVARELMTKYDVDGINLDFARWGYNRAYDEAALVEVMRRVDQARKEAEKKWGHPILIATRIPSYIYGPDSRTYSGEHPWFTAALQTWAREGWIDRVMPCVTWDKVHELSLQRYKAATSGTDVELWGDLYGPLHTGRPRSYYLDTARRWVAEGLEGGFFIYTRDRPTEYERINWMLRLIDFPGVNVEPYGTQEQNGKQAPTE